MNNLKRVLSLVMSGAMLVGMLAIGASAADKTFTDSNEITHVEAVNTMATLGVIKGKDTGAFDPKGNVTRAEMAKIVCVMLNGGEEPAWGTAINTTFSDTKGHWAEKYIAYCAANDIIAGQGDGTFNPDGNVTGAQAAKMMLAALGYKADIFHLTGAKWEDNTNTIAKRVKLYDDIRGLNTSAALNRDDTAQMAYNTLDAKCMETAWDSLSTTGEVTYKYAEGNETFLEKYFNGKTFVGTMVGNYDFKAGVSGVKLGEIAVNGKLIDQTDDAKRNATFPSDLDISNLGEEVKVIFIDKNKNNVPDKDDYIFGVFNTGNSSVVKANCGQVDVKYTKDNYMVKVNGVEYAVDKENGVTIWTNYSTSETVTDAGTALKGDNSNPSTLTSKLYNTNGDEMKLVMNADGEVATVYITHSVLAVVTAKNATNITMNNRVGSLKIAENDIPTDLAKDDVVVVTTLYNTAAPTSDTAYNIVRKAEKVSGEVTGYRDAAPANVRLSGATYGRVATLLTNNMPTGAVASFENGINETFDLYLVNGYVAGAVQTSESVSNYSLVTSISGSSDVPGDALAGLKIQVLGADNSKTVLTVSKDSKKADGTTAVATGADMPIGTIVTYTVNSTTGEADVFVKALAGTEGTFTYDKNTKAVGGVATTSDCVFFAKTADDYKAYSIRNLGDVAPEAGTAFGVAKNSDNKVVAAYVALNGTPAGAADTAVYGIISEVVGATRIDNVSYTEYTVMVNDTNYTVNSKDTTLAEGDVVTFEPTADKLYETNAVKKLVKSGSGDNVVVVGTTHWVAGSKTAVDLVGYVTDYNTADNLITVANATTLNTDTNSYDATGEQIYAIDKEVVISYVDKENNMGVQGSIGAFDSIANKANVVIRVNDEGLVTAIIFETSSVKDVI